MSSYTNQPDPQNQGWQPGGDLPPVDPAGPPGTDPIGAGLQTPPSNDFQGTGFQGDDFQGGSSQGGGSTADVAKQEAANVKDTAVGAGKDVASTAVQEAGHVVGEAKERAGDLLSTVVGELRGQVGSQQQRLADGLHSVASELGEMASKAEGSGPGSQLAHEASRRIGSVSHWLQDREPEDVLEEVREFARRRPGVFLTGAAVAGLLVGRLTRSVAASRTSLDSGSTGVTGRRSADAPGDYTSSGYVTSGSESGWAPTGASTVRDPAQPVPTTPAPASLTEEDMTNRPTDPDPLTNPWVDDTRNDVTR
ncbi:hypothetical protein GC722_09050 [Auraticoccus sp. F435]|uniref:DUF3618 domain-containing protein n=1 Tax=Auraticoccus cholistanensis TaxID=2656650 RepID=A0A6A9V0S9_9ACTN|nr:hypothetical protein [Auraticoccus cholistanensis]MVA76169.1 hypothetical protein [Auraticoccus cholistanensis]